MSRGNIYIAGPIRGLPQFNAPAFFLAEEILEAEGWEPFNPVALDIDLYGPGFGAAMMASETGDQSELDRFEFDIKATLAEDLRLVAMSDAIYMLDGWENSSGARAEKALAEALGIMVLFQDVNREAFTPEMLEGMEIGYQDGYQDAQEARR